MYKKPHDLKEYDKTDNRLMGVTNREQSDQNII